MAPSAAARAGLFRQQRGAGQVERLRDGAQHADRRIAGAAFDLRQVALGGLRGLRQLPPRHAALGALRRTSLPIAARNAIGRCGFALRALQPAAAISRRLRCQSGYPGVSCTIIHVRIVHLPTPTWQAAAANLTRKFSASRWVWRPARFGLFDRLPGRDRPAHGPAGSPDPPSAGRAGAAAGRGDGGLGSGGRRLGRASAVARRVARAAAPARAWPG